MTKNNLFISFLIVILFSQCLLNVSASELEVDIELINEYGIPSYNFHRGQKIGGNISIENKYLHSIAINLDITIIDTLEVPIQSYHNNIVIDSGETYISKIFLLIPNFTYVGKTEYCVIIWDSNTNDTIYEENLEFYTCYAQSLDIFTDRGGIYPEKIGCTYGPNELMTIYLQGEARLFGAPVELVIFDNYNNILISKNINLNENGVVSYYFRLPSMTKPESLFGRWRIYCSTVIENFHFFDELYFDFGYFLDIVEVNFTYNQNINEYDAVILIESIFCEDLSAILSISIEDEYSNSIITLYSNQVFCKDSITLTHFNDVLAPDWLDSQHHILFISLTGSTINNFGIPYCPMKTYVIR